mmetsp:Transcript_33128/g.105660  ORF Transcript_33128/g.105660 Transcript_33128/m.105660 type:complete len:294 (+) Transcript_33128:157-1038(+)
MQTASPPQYMGRAAKSHWCKRRCGPPPRYTRWADSTPRYTAAASRQSRAPPARGGQGRAAHRPSPRRRPAPQLRVALTARASPPVLRATRTPTARSPPPVSPACPYPPVLPSRRPSAWTTFPPLMISGAYGFRPPPVPTPNWWRASGDKCPLRILIPTCPPSSRAPHTASCSTSPTGADARTRVGSRTPFRCCTNKTTIPRSSPPTSTTCQASCRACCTSPPAKGRMSSTTTRPRRPTSATSFIGQTCITLEGWASRSTSGGDCWWMQTRRRLRWMIREGGPPRSTWRRARRG